MTEKIKAELIENFLVVWNPQKGSELYRLGYYGKPVGIPKPKIMDFNVPLILDVMEGLYLMEKKAITVTEGVKEARVGFRTNVIYMDAESFGGEVSGHGPSHLSKPDKTYSLSCHLGPPE